MSKMRFSKRKLHFLFFPFYVGDLETEKRKKKKKKMEKAKKPYKKQGFLKVVMQKCEKSKKMDF